MTRGMRKAVVLLVCTVMLAQPMPAADEQELRISIRPEEPTLLDEVTVEARALAAFGDQVRFELDPPDPATWRAVGESSDPGPKVRTSWRGDQVEHIAVWRLLPLLPVEAPLPEVRAERMNHDGLVTDRWQVSGRTVWVAPPPAAGRGVGEVLSNVALELPGSGRGPLLPLSVLALVVALALGWCLHRQRRGRKADATRESRIAALSDELRRVGPPPTREQVLEWRRLIPSLAATPAPEGLLAQADALLYQAEGFDPEAAALWARDLERWLGSLV